MSNFDSGRTWNTGGLNIKQRRSNDLVGIRFDADRSAEPSSANDFVLYRYGDALKIWDGSSATTLGAAGAVANFSLNDAYDDGRVITADVGAVTINATAVVALALTHNDAGANSVLTITTASATIPFSITSTNAGSVGPIIKVKHSSASQADADVIGELQFFGNDDAGTPAENEYVTLQAVATDSGAASEDGTFNLLCTVGGTQRTLLSAANDTVTVGNGAAHAYISSNGAYNLVLETAAGSSSGTITIVDGSAGAIALAPDSTGVVTVSTGLQQGGTTPTACTFAVAGTTGDGFHITTSTITSGNVFTIDHTVNATLSGGMLISAEVDSSAVFTVAEDGAVVIGGTAEGTNALTLTTGDIAVSDGDVTLAGGELSVTSGTGTGIVLASSVTSNDAMTITADSLTGTEAALSISVDGLVDGGGIKVENIGEAMTSGELLQILNTESGALAAKTGNVVSFTSSLTETTANRTEAYDNVLISRSDIANCNTFTLTSTGSTLKVLHTSTQTLGTLADSSVVLEVEQSGATGVTGDTVKVTSVGVGAQALNIVAAGTTADDVHIAGSGAHTSDKAVLNVTAAGNIATGGNMVRFDAGATDPNGGAIMFELDFAGLANTNEPTGVKIDAGGKKMVALSVDADPVVGDVAIFNCDSIVAADKAVIQVVTTGSIAAGGTAMRFDITGTPDADARVLEFDLAGVTDTNEPYGMFIDAGGKKVRAIYVDADPIANDVVHFHTDAVIAADKGVLGLSSTGAIANGGSMLYMIMTGAPAATAYAIDIDLDGVTDTNNPGAILIEGGAKDVRAIVSDTDNTDVSAVSITGSGALSGANMLYVANDATIAANTDSVVKFAFTGTATNDPICLDIDHNSIGAAINIDQDGNDGTDPAIGIHVNTDNAGAGNQYGLQFTMVDESKSYFARFVNDPTAWTSTKNPETDSQDKWLKVMVASTAYFIPIYAAS